MSSGSVATPELLLDTHAFIWWDGDQSKLSEVALVACQSPANTLHLSLASVWELQIEMQLGEIALRLPLDIRAAFKANEAFQKRMRDSGVKDHVPTKIVTLKVRLGDGEHVNPGMHLFGGGEKNQGRGEG
jgi:PIN domain nuclease of toxin-antitoxin system